MSKNKKRTSLFISFGNYRWAHFLVVGCFIVLGLLVAILPSVLSKKALIGSIIVGVISIGIGLFCIIDYAIVTRNKKHEEERINKVEENK